MRPTAVLIDDSIVTRTRLRGLLERLGLQVVAEGATGLQVMALYEEHLPSMLLLDIVLPELDGVAAATQLLRKYPEAPVVMCSSLTARDKLLECRAAGVKHFILKPCSPGSLASMVHKITGSVAAVNQSAVPALTTKG